MHLEKSIDNDATVKKNYDRYVFRTIDDVHDRESKADREQSVATYASSFIKRIAEPLERVLPGLKLESLGRPARGDATFYFSKNGKKHFHYKNLSGGDKATFDLLLDMVVKTEEFDDSILCIDEPEAHLNPAVQGQCLEELFKLTPDRCQLWLATHSIGMLRRARDLAAENSGSIVFLDFQRDLDQPVRIRPVSYTHLTLPTTPYV